VFDAFAIRPYPADVAAVDVTLGGVGVIELTVAGNAAVATMLLPDGAGTTHYLRPGQRARSDRPDGAPLRPLTPGRHT
jgi:hypothetical protein